MLKSVQQLAQTMEKEIEIYKEIKKISKFKTKMIQNEDIEGLKKMTSEEQGLVVALFKLEELREKVMDHVMRDKEIDSCENITELLKHLNLEEKVPIYKAKDQLQLLVKEVSEDNNLNQKLIEQKLEFIDVTVNLMTTANDESKYTPEANEKQVERKHIFDVKA